MEKKDYFLLNINLLETLKFLTMEEKGYLITAILEYENGYQPDLENLPGSVVSSFMFIKADLDKNREKYIAKCSSKSAAGKKSAEVRKLKRESKHLESNASATNNLTSNPSTELVESASTNSTSVESVTMLPTNLTDVNYAGSTLTKETVYETDDVDEYVDDSSILSIAPSLSNRDKCLRVIDLYNQHCPALTSAERKAHNKRVRAVEQVLSEMSEDELVELFKKANNTSFLTGKGQNNWVASFDWLVCPENLTKVKENIYVSYSPKRSFCAFQQHNYDFAELENQLTIH